MTYNSTHQSNTKQKRDSQQTSRHTEKLATCKSNIKRKIKVMFIYINSCFLCFYFSIQDNYN